MRSPSSATLYVQRSVMPAFGHSNRAGKEMERGREREEKERKRKTEKNGQIENKDIEK